MEDRLIKRKANRLKNFDYSASGAYFITICTKNRKCILSEIVGADIIRPCEIQLTQYGEIVKSGIINISKIYPNCIVNHYVIMPNHIHLIITIDNEYGRIISAPTVIGQFKRYVSKKCGFSIWQKSFYDHIIRDNEDYLTKAQYIENNPSKWQEDQYYKQEVAYGKHTFI